MRTICTSLAIISWVVISRADGAGLAQSENFIVLAADQVLADQVLSAAEFYRRQAALTWLGAELPSGAGRTIITAKASDSEDKGLSWTTDGTRRKLHRLWITCSYANAGGALLHHELTHIVLYTHCEERLPAWIDEGAASQVDDEERTAIRKRLIREFARSSNWPSLEAVFAAESIDASDQEAYSVAASVTEYLLTRGGPATLLRFGMAGQQHGWNQSLQAHYGIATVRALATEWQAWAARNDLAKNVSTPIH